MTKIYYGSETQKALENFPISHITVDYRIMWALADVKKASALANAKLGKIPEDVGRGIVQACAEIRERKFDDQFVTTVIQGGAGTSINMNVNEVVANRASEILGKERGYVSDLEHVNFSQSTNDSVPTAIKIASMFLLQDVINELHLLAQTFAKKGTEFADVIKVGRTHLQDAVPVSLGQEFNAYAVCAERGARRLDQLLKGEIRYINLGGTAIGTGIGSSQAFIEEVVKELSDITNLDLETAGDLVDATQNVDVFVDLSGRLKSVFAGLSKIANDLRMMAGGPRANLFEINLPERQKGSSIMPGKVNPVMPELINQVFFQILGNDASITEAASQGQFELNVMGPVLAFNLVQSLVLARNSLEVFRKFCIVGITANKERCRELLEQSFCTVTALNPHIGYYKATEVVKEAYKSEKTIREVVLAKGLMDESEAKKVLDPSKLVFPQ